MSTPATILRSSCRAALTAALVALCSCVTDNLEPAHSLITAGDRVPDFWVEMDNGTILASDDMIGRTSVLVFFNTDCADCRRELPVIDSLYRSRPDLIVACIARQESASQISAYWQANNLTVPYSAQPDRSVYNLFATEGIPRTYIVDENITVTAEFDDSNMPSLATLQRLTAAQ